MKQYGFFVDTSKCTGCKTCQISCKDEKDLDLGPKFRRVYEYEGGNWKEQANGLWEQDVYAYYVSIACNHCSEPACVKVCPTGAMHKREEDGVVLVNQEVCIGCRSCEKACPYGAPQFNAEKKKMTKCDACYERVADGHKPVCVEACPVRALDFDEIEVLRQAHGKESAIAPLPDPSLTQPNLVIKLCAHAKPAGDTSGHLANPQEVKSAN